MNGKKEKIASGLLNPFLSHLKAAQNQMDKGGYSIVLEPPEGNTDTSWFTKGTVERFDFLVVLVYCLVLQRLKVESIYACFLENYHW